MPKTVKRMAFAPKLPTLLKVAAYARVSSGKDAMHHSLSAQVSRYSEYIQSHPGWQYVGVYADEAKTGTRDSREQFQRLLADCRAGRIDLVITKSISRFARNTVTLLETVRELKELGVDVFFEEQNVHSLSTDGELMLTILASFAQAESLSVSENQKWRIKKNFEEGKPWSNKLFGYRLVDGRFEVVPEEADIVRRIFSEYLSGRGTTAIANGLNTDGVTTRRGYAWRPNVIAQTLRNYNYTGNLILQKTYRENHLTKRKLMNDDVLPKYHVSDSHEAIIDLETFEAVQTEIERRAEAYRHTKSCTARYPFSGLIICANCGKHYRRKTTKTGIVWICATFNTVGKAACASKQIPEERLLEMTADIDLGSIRQITAENGNRVRILLSDGKEIDRHWEDHSRAESWSDEMKEAARQRTLERNKHHG